MVATLLDRCFRAGSAFPEEHRYSPDITLRRPLGGDDANGCVALKSISTIAAKSRINVASY
jgi:hypothetical protein